MEKKYIDSLKGLDLLRFFSALAIITWHYQHFFYPFFGPVWQGAEYVPHQPFFEPLKLFYLKGNFAVQLFWMISGIVFYKVYHIRIFRKQVDFNGFLINRFSRLYPLHLLTLLIVLVLQKYLLYTQGEYFIYTDNSLKSFVKQLFFVQSWGLDKFSFNGPSWSVSIEMMVYLMFFMLCMSGFLKRFRNVVLTLFFFIVVRKWNLVFINLDITNVTNDIASCFYFFFAGCMLLKIIDYFQKRQRVLLALFFVSLASWLFLVLTPMSEDSTFHLITGFLDINVLFFSVSIILGFTLLFNLPFFDRVPDRYFRFFGNLTYAAYLIHFPVQIVMLIILKPAGYEVFYNPLIFSAYVLTVFVLGKLLYEYFELPMQNWSRKAATKAVAVWRRTNYEEYE